MATPPTRKKIRRTPGSKSLGAYIDRHGLRPVAIYIPLEWHRALSHISIESDTPLQALFTVACTEYYSRPRDLPPLIAPTRTKTDPHKNFTWYADIDLHKRIKMLAVDLECSAQQLILSAVIDKVKESPRIQALNIKTGYPPYVRLPDTGAELPKSTRA